MKKQSSRARAQSTPQVRHQLDHVVPTVIHNPEEDMTALGRWAHHAIKDPRRYVGMPALIIGGLVLAVVVWKVATSGTSNQGDLWTKLEAANTPAEKADLAKANPDSPVSTWAKLQAANKYFELALGDLPNNRDVALQNSKKALELFDQVAREAPHDSAQARVAALGKARILEMRNELTRAIEQYQLVARDWPNTPEADEAIRYAEALKDPEAAAFYKELYAYSPPKMDLPPMGTETFPPPGPGLSPPTAPGSTPVPGASPSSDTPPALAPGLGIPAIVEPSTGGTPKPAQPKTSTPAAKPEAAKPEAAKPAGAQKDLPAEVFSPKAKPSKR